MNETEKKQDIIIPESERVQFSKPETVSNYGQLVLNEIKKVVDAVARFRGNKIPVDLGPMQEVKGQIANFQEYMEGVEKYGVKAYDQSSQGTLKRFGMRILRVLSQSNNKQNTTFLECYESYQEWLTKIEENYNKRQEVTNAENGLLKSYIETIEPLLKELECYIKTGQDDLNQEMKKTEALGDQLPPDQMQVLKAAIFAFQRRLASLETALRTLQTSAAQTEVIIIGNLDLQAQYQEMISIGIPTLRTTSINMIATNQQSRKITELESERNALNQTMINQSEALSNNVDRLQNLTSKTMIDVETVKEVLNETKTIAEKIKTSREMAEAYNKQVEQFYEDSAEINRAINETLNTLVESASMNSSYAELNEETRQRREELEQALQGQEQGGKRLSFFNRFRRNNKN